MMDAGVIGGSAAAVFVPAVMVLIAKLIPYQPAKEQTVDVPYEELLRRYRAWEIGTLVPLILFTVLLTGMWFGVFWLLQQLVIWLLPSSQFLIVPPWPFWMCVAMLLGIVSSALPAHFLYLHLLGEERYREYTHYINLRTHFDAWRVLRWMGIAIAIATAIVAPPALECYTRFTDDTLIENAFFSFGETIHPYKDIQELRTVARRRAPNGKIVDKPYYQIVFKDGFIWSSTRVMAEPLPETAREIMEFMSKQTDLPLKPYNLAPEQE